MRPFCFFAACLILLLELFGNPVYAASSVVLPKGTRIKLQLNDRLSTKLNSEGDYFSAVVITPVYSDELLVIPKGSIVSGSISRILRPGRFKGKAAINLLFHSIRIPGRGEDTPIAAVLVRMDADASDCFPCNGSAAGEGSRQGDTAEIIAPGISGAGARAGWNRSAGIEGGIGAITGLAMVFTSSEKDLEIQRGSTLDIALERPSTIPLGEDEAVLRNR